MYLTNLRTYLVLLFPLVFSGCESDESPGEPVIRLLDGIELREGNPGERFEVSLDIFAPAGLKSLATFENGSLSGTVELTNGTSGSHDFIFDIPFSAPFLSEYEFEFILTDQLDRTSSITISLKITGRSYTLEPGQIGSETVTVLKGRVFEQLTLDTSTKYLLDSIVTVEEGGEIMIPAGTWLYGRHFGENPIYSRLSILKGGRIVASGTKENPIVFTSEKVLTGNPGAGDWGGLYVAGDLGDPGNNSGVVKFVRIEYAGGGTTYGSFELRGVGSGTSIDHVQVWNSDSRSFSVVDGTVNLRHIVSTNQYRHDLVGSFGWSGKVQFFLAEQNRNEKGNTCIFIRGIPTNDIQAGPTVSNVTCIGTGELIDSEDNDGIKFRDGGIGRFYNALVTQFGGEGIRSDHASEHITGIDGTFVIAHSIAWHNKRNFWKEAMAFIDDPAYQNSISDPGIDVGLSSYIGVVGEGAFDPTGLDPWFEPANYIGAVPSNYDWTADGNWCKNRDGSIR